MSYRSGSSSSDQPDTSVKRKRLVSRRGRIPEPCDLFESCESRRLYWYPFGMCVTVVDDDDLTTHLPSSSNTPVADLEDANLGISSYEYPNAGLCFDIHMRCLSSSYQAVGGFLVRKESIPFNTKIWKRYRYIATKNVVRDCSSALVTIVNFLLPMVFEMEGTSIRDVSESTIEKWEDMISTCESMEFNVGWLRQRFDIIKVDQVGIIANVVPAANGSFFLGFEPFFGK